MGMLSKGSKGEEVKKLQTALNRAGCSLTIDGVYGAKTEQAVFNFQEDNGLQMDGVTGPKTWEALAPYMVDYSLVSNLLEKCLDAIEELPEFKTLENLLNG